MTESVGATLILKRSIRVVLHYTVVLPVNYLPKTCAVSLSLFYDMLQIITTFWAFAQDFSSFVLQDDKSRIHFSDNIRSASFSKCSLNLHVVC